MAREAVDCLVMWGLKGRPPQVGGEISPTLRNSWGLQLSGVAGGSWRYILLQQGNGGSGYGEVVQGHAQVVIVDSWGCVDNEFEAVLSCILGKPSPPLLEDGVVIFVWSFLWLGPPLFVCLPGMLRFLWWRFGL